MKNLLVVILIISATCLFAKGAPRPIEGWEYEYISQAFPTASLIIEQNINDNEELTEGSPNTVILEILDATDGRLGFIREVYTSAGCLNVCAPLDFTISFDAKGKYLIVIKRESMPLEKDFGSSSFDQDDYKHLHYILKNTPASYALAEKSTDLADAETGATKVEYENDVVPTAAFTCFKMHQYKEQTLTEIINLIASRK